MQEHQSASPGRPAHLSLHIKPGGAHSAATYEPRDLAMVPSCLQLQHILVPVDFSSHAEKALKYAKKFVEQFGSKVTVLHVIQPMVYPADFGYPPTVLDTEDQTVRKQVEDKLADIALAIAPGCQTLVRTGQPYNEISTAARELNVDLIIINTHGHTGLKHVLLGSTAERVVRYAPCPVLTVREKEHDFV